MNRYLRRCLWGVLVLSGIMLSGCPQSQFNTIVLKNTSEDFVILEWYVTKGQVADLSENLLSAPLEPGDEGESSGYPWGQHVLTVVYERQGSAGEPERLDRSITLGFSGERIPWEFAGPGIHKLVLVNASEDRQIQEWYVAGSMDIGYGENLLSTPLASGESKQLTGLEPDVYASRIVHAVQGISESTMQEDQVFIIPEPLIAGDDEPRQYSWIFEGPTTGHRFMLMNYSRDRDVVNWYIQGPRDLGGSPPNVLPDPLAPGESYTVSGIVVPGPLADTYTLTIEHAAQGTTQPVTVETQTVTIQFTTPDTDFTWRFYG